jgi:hypothetical protein
VDRFEVALTRIREQAAFLGKEWMYTGAATSAQPQAATRYFLAAMAILDDALEAYIDKNWKEAPRDVSNLGKRIAFLKLEGRLAEPAKLETLRHQRNQYAHEPESLVI